MEMYKFVQSYDDDIYSEMHLRVDAIIEFDKTRREAHSRNDQLHI